MTKTVKIIIVIAVVLVIAAGAVLGGVFGARAVQKANREKAERQAAAQRQEAVASVKQNFLCGINENWKSDMTDEELKALEDAGDYVVFAGWTEFALNTFKNSPLQTAKINLFAEALASEDGKKLFDEFEDNAELLIPLLRSVGFSSDDVAYIVYALIEALIEDGATTLNSMKDKLQSIRSATNASNVNESISTVSAEIEYLTFTQAEKREILTAVSGAESAIKELVAFAYTTSIETLTNNMVEVITSEDGALADITNSEIETVVNAALINVRKLKAALTTAEIVSLNNAIKTITDKFDGRLTTSRVLSRIVNYAKYVYIFTDSIPYLADMVISASHVVDADFLNIVRDYVENVPEYSNRLKNVNELVIYARVEKQLLENIDKSELDALIEVLGAQAETDYKRAIPIIALDAGVNLISVATSEEKEDMVEYMAHPELWNDSDLKKLVLVCVKFIQLSEFEDAYFNYIEGNGTRDSLVEKLRQAANNCSFSSSIENGGLEIPQNPYDRESQTDEWCKYYLNAASAKMVELIAGSGENEGLLSIVKADLHLSIDDYYVEDSPIRTKLAEFAEAQLLEPLPDGATEQEAQAFEENINAYITSANESRVLWVYLLIDTLLKLVK